MPPISEIFFWRQVFFVQIPWCMWIMTINTMFTGIMFFQVDLEDDVFRFCGIPAVAQSAELPFVVQGEPDRRRVRSRGMLQARTVTGLAGEYVVEIIVFLFDDVLVALGTRLVSGKFQILVRVVRQGICAVVAIFSETFRNQEMPANSEQSDEDDEQEQERFQLWGDIKFHAGGFNDPEVWMVA